jgi:hypothetical protein
MQRKLELLTGNPLPQTSKQGSCSREGFVSKRKLTGQERDSYFQIIFKVSNSFCMQRCVAKFSKKFSRSPIWNRNPNRRPMAISVDASSVKVRKFQDLVDLRSASFVCSMRARLPT